MDVSNHNEDSSSPSSASLHLRLQGEAFDHNAGWGQGVWWSEGATLYGPLEASCFNIAPLSLTSRTLCLCACHYSRVRPRSGRDLADKDVADGIDNRAEAQTGDALQHTWGSGAVRDHGMDIFNINLSVPFITRSRSSVQQISVMLRMFDLHHSSQITQISLIELDLHSSEHLFPVCRCLMTCSGVFWVPAVWHLVCSASGIMFVVVFIHRLHAHPLTPCGNCQRPPQYWRLHTHPWDVCQAYLLARDVAEPRLQAIECSPLNKTYTTYGLCVLWNPTPLWRAGDLHKHTVQMSAKACQQSVAYLMIISILYTMLYAIV